mmetsp:Transcript_30763/g.49119  ORF Transcript_30763/g.49119 Transcript_30763/m.49119 type:complete len:88 (-) Transcript_30763:96-359(-)
MYKMWSSLILLFLREGDAGRFATKLDEFGWWTPRCWKYNVVGQSVVKTGGVCILAFCRFMCGEKFERMWFLSSQSYGCDLFHFVIPS